MPTKRKPSRRTYEVAGERTDSFDVAAGRAVVLLALARRETVCIETIVNGSVVEAIDVNVALSIDPVE